VCCVWVTADADGPDRQDVTIQGRQLRQIPQDVPELLGEILSEVLTVSSDPALQLASDLSELLQESALEAVSLRLKRLTFGEVEVGRQCLIDRECARVG
jgi:hypothetical protein